MRRDDMRHGEEIMRQKRKTGQNKNTRKYDDTRIQYMARRDD